MNTEVLLVAAVANTAARVEPESTTEMAKGPASLQKRSIRRICAFIMASLASSVPAITTVQSRSTETVLSTALSFSMQAKTDRSVNATVLPSIECAHLGKMRRMKNPKHEMATGRRCPTSSHQRNPVERTKTPCILIDSRTALRRSALSMYAPSQGESKAADAARANAYTDAGNSVLG